MPAADAAIRAAARPLTTGPGALDPIVDRAAAADAVVVGLSARGTAEQVAAGARLALRLADDAGLRVLAIDADAPDVEPLDAYVRGASGAASTAQQALATLHRFPSSLLATTELAALLAALRRRNDERAERERIAVVGLDRLRRDAAAEAALSHLAALDPRSGQLLRRRLGDADHVERAADTGALPGADRLAALLDRLAGAAAPGRQRAMLDGGGSAFSERALRLAETLEEVAGAGLALVLTDLTQAGDGRASTRGARGEATLGALARERLGAVVLVGVTLHHGATLAAAAFGGETGEVRVRHALPESYEALLHATGLPALVLPLDAPGVTEALAGPRLLRTIGAVYRPETERRSHYADVALPCYLDALIHVDEASTATPVALARA